MLHTVTGFFHIRCKSLCRLRIHILNSYFISFMLGIVFRKYKHPGFFLRVYPIKGQIYFLIIHNIALFLFYYYMKKNRECVNSYKKPPQSCEGLIIILSLLPDVSMLGAEPFLLFVHSRLDPSSPVGVLLEAVLLWHDFHRFLPAILPLLQEE